MHGLLKFARFLKKSDFFMCFKKCALIFRKKVIFCHILNGMNKSFSKMYKCCIYLFYNYIMEIDGGDGGQIDNV